MEETIFCYLFCFWEPPGHVTCSYCEYCLKKSWLTTLRLKSSFHIWGFLYSISPTWIRGLQVVAENVWHLCSLKGSSTDNVLEQSSAVTSQICSPEHRKRHCFVLSVCWVHLLSTCSSHTAPPQFTSCWFMYHVQHQQGQDEEWSFQLHLVFLFSAYFKWVLWLIFLAPASV